MFECPIVVLFGAEAFLAVCLYCACVKLGEDIIVRGSWLGYAFFFFLLLTFLVEQAFCSWHHEISLVIVVLVNRSLLDIT